MQTIKKYANRKLYHINKKQYITLDGIARLVQSGEAVQVLDNETGDDITASILSQVVLHSRNRSGGPLPTTVLTGLIQVGGDTLSILRRTVLSSLGGQDTIDMEISQRIEKLLSAGLIGEDEAGKLRRLLLRPDFFDPAINEVQPGELDFPSRNDVARLHAQVDALTATVEQLLRLHGMHENGADSQRTTADQ